MPVCQLVGGGIEKRFHVACCLRVKVSCLFVKDSGVLSALKQNGLGSQTKIWDLQKVIYGASGRNR
jgi:hypothetical protein